MKKYYLKLSSLRNRKKKNELKLRGPQRPVGKPSKVSEKKKK